MQLYYRGCYDLSEERYLDIISRKTGSLTSTCCYLGSRLSGASEMTAQSLEQYGMNLGVAFQIMDDILDITGDEKTAGKSLGRDIMMEKLTLPGIHYQRNSKAEEQRWVRETLGKAGGVDYIEYVDKLHAAGSIDYAQSRGLEFIDRAKHSLSQSDLDGDVIEILAELVDAVML